MGTPKIIFPHYLAENADMIHYTAGTIYIISVHSYLTEENKENFASGDFRYGIYTTENIPYILFDFGSFQIDFPCNAYEIFEMDRDMWLNAKDDVNVIMLILKNNPYKVMQHRNLHIESRFILQLKGALRDQVKAYKNEAEVNLRIRLFSETLATSSMIQNAKMYRYKNDLS
jgi:hypothetical protein